ncbi:MAG: antitoxin VbhA family protein [Candidatus Accumulibacter sp.]|nr:antitoxin VbhA family protein [Accumulibacter sp.]
MKHDARQPLTAKELLERREAVDFARANVELEGFKAAPEFEVLTERYASGEIDLEEYRVLAGLPPGKRLI